MGLPKETSKPNSMSGCDDPVNSGKLTCPTSCDIKLKDYEQLPYTPSMMSADRYSDSGPDKKGVLQYTTNILKFSGSKGKFDIKYIKSENVIKLFVRVNFILYDINLKDASGKIKKDKKGNPITVPFYSRKKAEGLKDASGNTYVYVARKKDDDTKKFISGLKSKVEKILSANQYYLEANPCCKKLTPCPHKIPIKFEVEFGDNLTSAHKTVNLFPSSERANTSNWGQVKTNGDVHRTAAHEVGHYLGWPDEYYKYGGAVHNSFITPEKKIDETKKEENGKWKRYSEINIMGAGSLVQPYYMCHARDWFKSKTNKSWKIVK